MILINQIMIFLEIHGTREFLFLDNDSELASLCWTYSNQLVMVDGFFFAVR